jgi:hypothetical protein
VRPALAAPSHGVEIQTAYLDTVRGRSERWSHWLDFATRTPAEA